ncbi:MAG TPA: response regulator [Candidatus Paceibacterota bacterium]|nr:response regulator [Candidatus Paceibacterota bacterium]
MQEPTRKILVLEDERQLAKAVREAFSERGFEPIVVSTVDDGIKQLENMGGVDVIWLDHYLLGSGNGLDFVVQVKNHPEWKNIPIFVVSNTASTTNVRSYLQLGVSNYYTKSDFDINQIVNDIEYALAQSAGV